MLILILAAELSLAIFLLGSLCIALGVTMRHGDPSATYKLYAVRDSLIEASVFKGVPREDPWLESLYDNVNSVLLHSNLLSGPSGWPLAVAVGHYQAANPDRGKRLRPLPQGSDRCPAHIRALGPSLRQALEHLTRHHLGWYLQMNTRERERSRVQQEKARMLLAMIQACRGADEALVCERR